MSTIEGTSASNIDSCFREGQESLLDVEQGPAEAARDVLKV